MINANNNLKLVQASAWYDLLATAVFVTPWTTTFFLKGFALLSGSMELDRPVPMLDVTQMLFANLLGSVVVIWSLWRLRHPSHIAGLYDALARVLFVVWQLYAVAHGASLLILGFTVLEVIFAILQSLPVAEVMLHNQSSDGLDDPHKA